MVGTLASRLHFTAQIYKEIMEKTLVEPLAATLRNNLLQYLEKNRQRSISSMLKDIGRSYESRRWWFDR
ncbi:hypothetical protein ACG7TL_009191 [Trametes sanguinea]